MATENIGVISALDSDVTQRSDMSYTDKSTRKEFAFTTEEFLEMAPCPPVWNKALFWEVTDKTNLTQDEINTIVVKCDIPLQISHGSAMESGVSCNTTCVVLCSVLCGMLIFLLIPVLLVWWSKKRVKAKEKFDDVCHVKTIAQNHDGGVVIPNGHFHQDYTSHFYEEIGPPNLPSNPETPCYEENREVINMEPPEVPMRPKDQPPSITNISQRIQPNFGKSHGCKNPVYEENDSNYYNPPIVEDAKKRNDNDHMYKKRHTRGRGKLNRAFAVEETDHSGNSRFGSQSNDKISVNL